MREVRDFGEKREAERGGGKAEGAWFSRKAFLIFNLALGSAS